MFDIVSCIYHAQYCILCTFYIYAMCYILNSTFYICYIFELLYSYFRVYVLYCIFINSYTKKKGPPTFLSFLSGQKKWERLERPLIPIHENGSGEILPEFFRVIQILKTQPSVTHVETFRPFLLVRIYCTTPNTQTYT